MKLNETFLNSTNKAVPILSLLLLNGCNGTFALQTPAEMSKSGPQAQSFAAGRPSGAGKGTVADSQSNWSSLGQFSASHTGSQGVAGGFNNLYAPSVIGGLMISGGWLTAADIGPDKLYISTYWGGPASTPQPLNFVNPGFLPGQVTGFHANDPSAISIPGTNEIFVYYTSLPNDDDAHMMARNHVGLTVSSDGGQSWWNSGEIIGQFNGIDGTGAWAPSALVQNGEIWVYYHTGSDNCTDDKCIGSSQKGMAPRILRTRFTMNGWQSLATDQMVNQNGGPLNMCNIDITIANGKYWLVGNTGSLGEIAMYTSNDGVHFSPFDGGAGVLLHTDTGLAVTPNIQFTSPNSFNLLFGWDSDKSNFAFDSIQQWSFYIQPVAQPQSAADSVAPPPAQPVPASVIMGNLDGISGDSNGATIWGWSCESGLSQSISVDLYLDGAAGAGGTFAGRFAADVGSEQAVGDACADPNNTPHRFQIYLDSDFLSANGGRSVYIHGISPDGADNLAITNSGSVSLP